MMTLSMPLLMRSRPPAVVGRLLAAAGAALLLAPAVDAAEAAEPRLPAADLRPVQRLEMTLPNGDPADVYLPRAAPVVPNRFEDALPLIALLQGAFVDKAEYSRVARLIAEQGFVVVVPNHAQTLPQFPQPVLFAEVDTVNAVHDAMAAADADPASPLHRIVDTAHMGLVGHSLGGAVGLYAIAGVCVPGICSSDPAAYRPPAALKTAVVYGASLFDRRTGALVDVDTSGAAVALIQGRRDGIAAQEKARPSYDALEPPRALLAVEGANHYAICDRNNPPGAEPDPSEPTLPQIRGNQVLARWIGLWLRAQMLGDAAARAELAAGGAADGGVVEVLAVEP
jgi:hypothetical protein